jgi:dolichol-phosphate mannosyltransferase
VIPIYNEEDNILPLYQRLMKVLSSLDVSYEILFVDDGSTDGSAAQICELHRQNSQVAMVRFSRNFGHQAAVMAGLEHSRGDCVITLDGDLQHPPELLPQLIERWREGYDVVYTIRQVAKDTGWFKKVTSRLFYKLVNRLARVQIPEGASDFRLLDRRVVDTLKSLKEQDLFFRGLVPWMGFKQVGLSYQAEPRHAGVSKYSMAKMLGFAVSGVTDFSSVPLHLATFMGIAVAGLSFLYGTYVVLAWIFTDRVIAGWPSVIVSVLFLGGVQLISIGIIGEYIGRIFNEVKGRPRYIIQEVLRHDTER